MARAVRIAEFKKGLSRYLRSAQRGHEIIIKDRDTPIARLLPFDDRLAPLVSTPPKGSLKDVDKLPFFCPEGLTLEDLEQAIREERRERF